MVLVSPHPEIEEVYLQLKIADVDEEISKDLRLSDFVIVQHVSCYHFNWWSGRMTDHQDFFNRWLEP